MEMGLLPSNSLDAKQMSDYDVEFEINCLLVLHQMIEGKYFHHSRHENYMKFRLENASNPLPSQILHHLSILGKMKCIHHLLKILTLINMPNQIPVRKMGHPLSLYTNKTFLQGYSNSVQRINTCIDKASIHLDSSM